MGREWTTDTSRGGKFMFGIQPSDAPRHLGMHEQTQSTIDYYADEDDVEHIKAELNKRYDTLGVPEEMRIYLLPKDYDEWADKHLLPLVFETVPEDKAPKDAIHWASKKAGCIDIEKDKKKTEAYADIYLALTILTDIEDDGYCQIEAEV